MAKMASTEDGVSMNLKDRQRSSIHFCALLIKWALETMEMMKKAYAQHANVREYYIIGM